MSKFDKILSRLLTKPKDFTWNEMIYLLTSLGFSIYKGDGSKRKFTKDNIKIILHEPHPQKTILVCYLKEVIEILKEEKLI